MKVYFSYSSRGYQRQPSKDLINIQKLSAYFAKQSYGNIHFLTDSESECYFQDVPWTSVETSLDSVSHEYPDVWSLSKLEAYKIIAKKGDPFVHVDYDVILWRPLPEWLFHTGVFAQCPEQTIGHLYETEKFFLNCPNKHCFDLQAPDYAYNVGIFGGSDLDFIYSYADSAIKFVVDPANKNFWAKYSGYSKYWCKATLAEQHFLASFAAIKNKEVRCLFPYWPTESMAIERNYTHLMAGKSMPHILKRVEELCNIYCEKNS